ncbi:MAG: hypothetical protein IT229_13030 [Flavobacteriales bacterium]|nr:hypothetical protein [Flavobacteriales bacterium]
MNILKNHALSLLMLGAIVALVPACKKKEGCTDPTATNYDPDAEKDCCCEYAPTSDKVTIDQPISANTTWTADKKYLIKGFIEVESGATLTIEAGTRVFGDKATKGTLIINRGGKIEALGTSSNPIVFTSNEAAGSRAPGDWGGIILCGKAPVNLPGGTGVVEGGVEAVFGGTDAADNSGTLQFVRIEYPGIAFQPNNEINGLTLAGVGNGTVIDHVQVSYSGDDSFEWFGGTVNCKNLVAFGGLDDDFDMDNGYSGKFQFGVSLRDPNQADASGSNGLEHDNDASGSGATPYTTPVLTNISIYGPQATASTTINSNYKRSGHLRRNTHSRVFNSVFAGFPTGLLIDGSACETNADAGDLKVKDCVYSAMGTLTAVASGSTWDIAAWFAAGSNTTYTDNAQLGVNDAFNLTAPDFTLTGSSPLASGASFSNGDLNDPFFTSVSYKGAFGTDNWTSGWANWTPQNTPY